MNIIGQNIDNLRIEILNTFNNFGIDNYAVIAVTEKIKNRNVLSTFDSTDNPATLLDLVSSHLQHLFLTYDIPAEDLNILIDSIKEKQEKDKNIMKKSTKQEPSSEKNFIWDEEMLIGYVKTSETGKLSISLVSKDNNTYVSLSKMYRTKTDPTFKFSKGFTIPIEKAEQISNLIKKAALEGE